jgi:hypothetical protein
MFCMLQLLEEIDDDLDELGIMFVKMDDEKEAEEYGINKFPSIGNFFNYFPSLSLCCYSILLDKLLYSKCRCFQKIFSFRL